MLRPIIPQVGQGLLVHDESRFSYAIVCKVNYHKRLFKDHLGIQHEWADIRLDQGCGLADILDPEARKMFIRYVYLRTWYLAEYIENFEAAEGKVWNNGPHVEYLSLISELEGIRMVNGEDVFQKWHLALSEAEELMQQAYRKKQRGL